MYSAHGLVFALPEFAQRRQRGDILSDHEHGGRNAILAAQSPHLLRFDDVRQGVVQAFAICECRCRIVFIGQIAIASGHGC